MGTAGAAVGSMAAGIAGHALVAPFYGNAVGLVAALLVGGGLLLATWPRGMPKAEIYRAAFEACWADRVITRDERAVLEEVRARLWLSEGAAARVEALALSGSARRGTRP